MIISKKQTLVLGCVLPIKYAEVKLGDTVIDIGCGAGNDVFMVRSVVENNGKVIKIDMTEEMINRAINIRDKPDIKGVEFKLGDIENLLLENVIADVVISRLCIKSCSY